MPEAFNEDDVRAFYRLLRHGGHGWTELRLIDPKRTAKALVGFYDDEDAFATTCRKWNGKRFIYAGRNPRPASLLEKSPQARNKVVSGIEGGKAEDIVILTALSIDIDPVRQKDTPSTEEEHALALSVAERVAADYPNSVLVDSGNGAHVVFPIEPLSLNGDAHVLEAKIRAWEEEIREYVEEDPRLKVDSIHDLPRIIKVPGTLSIKGEPTEERPHRLARIVSPIPGGVCDLSEVLSREVAAEDVTPEWSAEPGDPPARFFTLLRTDEKLRLTWEGKRSDLQDQSGSGYDMSLASQCAGQGFSPDETYRILRTMPEGVGTHDDRRIRLTVKKAFKDYAVVARLPSGRQPRELVRRVDEIRRLKIPAWQQHRHIGDLIVHDLTSHGFLVRGERTQAVGWYFENSAKRLLPIGDPLFTALIHDRFGVSEGEKTLFAHVTAALRTECLQRGTPATIYRVAHYDRNSGLLYVSRFDGQMYRLNGESVEPVPNGTDGVLFFDDPTFEPWEYSADTQEGALLGLLVDSVNFASGEGVRLQPDEQRALYGIWIRLLFFPELLPTKPILLLLGDAGSGKTTTLRLLLKTLFGGQADVETVHRKKEDAFVASISENHLAAFDNVDAGIDWLNDRLATCATGGRITLRKLYTTNETYTVWPRCFLAITARTPKFRREDVADRLLIFRVARLAHFQPEEELLAERRARRNEILSELLDDLNEIVRALRSGVPKGSVRFRMADFGKLAEFVSQVSDGDQGAKILRAVLTKMEEEQGDYTIEEEPIYLALMIWLESERNRGREVQTKELFDALCETAKANKLYWPYSNPIVLGRRLGLLWTALAKRVDAERETKRGNVKCYRFAPKGALAPGGDG